MAEKKICGVDVIDRVNDGRFKGVFVDGVYMRRSTYIRNLTESYPITRKPTLAERAAHDKSTATDFSSATGNKQ